jgi:hypothetical protein
VIEDVKKSGLRGRGGAGFPTGLKWQFVDKKSPKPKYIVCNADESEPGTFKDHLLMERNPHMLVEGCVIGCYAIGSKAAYIYIRGEFQHLFPTMQKAIDDARRRASSARTSRVGLRLRGSTCIAAPAPMKRARKRAPRIARRQARPAAIQAAIPRGRRRVEVPDRRQQRRDALQRPARDDARRRMVRVARAREERRARSCSASAARSSVPACSKRR